MAPKPSWFEDETPLVKPSWFDEADTAAPQAVSSKPTFPDVPEPGFFQQLLNNRGELGSKVWNGLWDLPGDMLSSFSNTIQNDYKGQINPDISQGQGELPSLETVKGISKNALGMLPGGRTLGTEVEQIADKKLRPALGLDPQLPDVTQKDLANELTNELGNYIPGMAIGGLGGRQARRFGQDVELFKNREPIGLIKEYGESKGFNNTSTGRQTAARMINDPAALTAEVAGIDSNAARSFAAGDTLKQAGDDIIASKFLQSGGAPNPYKISKSTSGKEVATFEDGPPPRTFEEAVQRAQSASDNLIQTGNTIADDLTAAQLAFNADSTGQLISGIRVSDISPYLEKTRDLIRKRLLNEATTPEARALQETLRSVENDINRRLTTVYSGQPGASVNWNNTRSAIGKDPIEQGGISKYGDPSAIEKDLPLNGEISIKDTFEMLQNLNQARRKLGEFDELVKAKGMNSTFSDLTKGDAEVHALGAASDALKNALSGKTREILDAVKGGESGVIAPEFDKLTNVDSEIFGRINNTYSALQPFREAANRFDLATSKGFQPTDPGTLLGKIDKSNGLKAGFGLGDVRIPQGVTDSVMQFFDSPNQRVTDAQALLDRRAGPMRNLEIVSKLRNQGIPDVAFADRPGFSFNEMLAGGAGAQMSQQPPPQAYGQMAGPEMPFPRSMDAVLSNKEQFASRVGILTAKALAAQMGPMLAAAPKEGQQAAMEAASRAREETLNVLNSNDTFRIRELLSATGKMHPELFQTNPGEYQSQIDNTIDAHVDGPQHAAVTLQALQSGAIDSVTAANQVHELNSKPNPTLIFKPNQPQAMPQVASPDVTSAVQRYLGRPIGSAGY